jgi:hypothetical protein
MVSVVLGIVVNLKLSLLFGEWVLYIRADDDDGIKRKGSTYMRGNQGI